MKIAKLSLITVLGFLTAINSALAFKDPSRKDMENPNYVGANPNNIDPRSLHNQQIMKQHRANSGTGATGVTNGGGTSVGQ